MDELVGEGIDLNAQIVESNADGDGLCHENGDEEQVSVLSQCAVYASPSSECLFTVDCGY